MWTVISLKESEVAVPTFQLRNPLDFCGPPNLSPLDGLRWKRIRHFNGPKPIGPEPTGPRIKLDTD